MAKPIKTSNTIDKSANFDCENVKAALDGRLSVDDLSAAEQAVFMDNFDEAINSNLEQDFSKHFEKLSCNEKFYGLNGKDKIICETRNRSSMNKHK
ncbi:hypothetical protein PSH47_14185 [Pseudoalteromonas sp. CST5]|uniref:hypothetical protein n=1 Tax=unclassified Pseudoalteromonas TaxID=194690 RepID=UPI002359FC5F|nr:MULTISPECIES: hypothetical protein [unclassified Pseudoalteromonas]MDC9515464.1 hypothetical protein [Pseudoalteromonas sp. CST1]MDC9539299.1 hypothetical protein [Pseudoalteromonas sp. CST3]MDC9542767.1 hypothetical protein [Pseudoalteromonas sp. CST2]MDC9547465.1 hypothetical protein [Pseudoalteromonas sp. CST4]MDC9550301.1 hypothetical protein [Pseudoalteromonas sp. CST5]